MQKLADSEKGTKERLLESACRVFTEKGFRDATVADICDDAEANIAAVNYHFGSKEELYREVWRGAVEANESVYGTSEENLADPHKWLKAHIRNRVLSIFDKSKAGCFPRLMERGMANPTDIDNELREEFLAPRIRESEGQMKKLLGERASQQQVRCCVINIVSLYAFLNLGKMARDRLVRRDESEAEQLEAIVKQMQVFAMAAVEGVRAEIERGEL
jgi:AcrR family transcriptional regulator